MLEEKSMTKGLSTMKEKVTSGNMKIVVFGLIGSGKDTFADLLKEKLEELSPSLKFERSRYAQPLKEICYEVFGEVSTNDRELKEVPCSLLLRPEDGVSGLYLLDKAIGGFVEKNQLAPNLHEDLYKYLVGFLNINSGKVSPRGLQKLIGEWGRSISPNFWVNLLKDENLIISDGRFSNEKGTINIFLYDNTINLNKECYSALSEYYNKYLQESYQKFYSEIFLSEGFSFVVDNSCKQIHRLEEHATKVAEEIINGKY